MSIEAVTICKTRVSGHHSCTIGAGTDIMICCHDSRDHVTLAPSRVPYEAGSVMLAGGRARLARFIILRRSDLLPALTSTSAPHPWAARLASLLDLTGDEITRPERTPAPVSFLWGPVRPSFGWGLPFPVVVGAGGLRQRVQGPSGRQAADLGLPPPGRHASSDVTRGPGSRR